MDYDFVKIGERLRKLRKEKKWSQEELIYKLGHELNKEKKINISRRKYSDIENGIATKQSFNLGLLSALAELYECEIGYLLCEYDCRTGRNTDIQKELGLSDKTIDLIKAMSKEEIKTLEAYINTGSNITMLLMLEFWYQSFGENIMVYGNGTSQPISKEMKENMIEYSISKQSVNIFNNILHDESTRDFFDKFLENENPISEAVEKGFLCE